MQKLTVFYMQGCPYCVSARRAMEALQSEDERYRAVEIEWIDENRQPKLAWERDYYYVPSVFMGDEKLYECKPAHSDAVIAANLRAAFERAAGEGEGRK